MPDSALFISGSLFSTDYLVEGIRNTAAYQTVDVAHLLSEMTRLAAAFPQSHRTNESQTETDFIWPILGLLGWADSLQQQNLTVAGRDDVPDGLLFASAEAKAAANALHDQWRRYAHGQAIVESKRWARPLDRASGRDEATAPSTQMLRYLRRIDDLTHGQLRWGILTNGNKWRLYWAGARSVSEEFLEIDLGRALALDGDTDLFSSEADRMHWLRVFGVMFARAAFIKGAGDQTFHESARSAAAFYEERVAASLSKLVFEQVFPSFANAIATAAPKAALHEVRDASLILLYRLLFLLYAEDRDLLPVTDKRYDDYALRLLRLDVGKRITDGDAMSSTASRIWGQIADLSRIIDKGDVSVGIPPYNGGLFASDGGSLLDGIRIPDAVMAPALDALSYERSLGERRYINYRDLSVQQLGSIYERLLEYEIVRSDDDSLLVRPNIFARKNSGSYYTPDDLVGVILDETLEPLISERLNAFRSAIEALEPTDSEDSKRRDLREYDPATAILSLRVCDPAMGSGHFLVSLVDTLADHVLDAMAEAAALGAGAAYTSPLANQIEDIRSTILRNAKASKWSIDEAQLDDRHIVRRMVLKRCVYGVDKNPMAVELAKVALWLHTFTVGAPLSFIDHHLRAGDSLFGLWVRDGIDKARKRGGGELMFAEPLRNAARSAAAMKTIETLTDAEIAEAHRSAAMYTDVGLMTGGLDSFVSMMNAFDWLAPDQAEDKAAIRALLDGLYGDPIAIAAGSAAPRIGRTAFEKSGEGVRMERQAYNASDLLERVTSLIGRARALVTEERFLNWQIAFPGVWSDWSEAARQGGFDAVVGNPPWDRFEFEEVPWFEARDRSIALETSGAKRKARIEALKAANDPLYTEFKTASDRLLAATRAVRTGKIYSKLNVGKLNLFKMFVERALQLVKPDGMIGLLVPIGIGTDNSSSDFFTEITENKRLKAFLGFENKRRWLFADVHSEDQPTILVASGGSRSFEHFSYAVKLHQLPNTPDAPVTTLTASTLGRVNPNTKTAPIFRTAEDLRLVISMYEKLPVLVDKSTKPPTAVWPTKYMQMINMTSDSKKFRSVKELLEEEGAWSIGNGRYESAAGEWVPLLEGKSIQIFNHRFASIFTPEGSVSGQGQSIYATDDELADPTFGTTPRHYVLAGDVIGIDKGYTIGFNDVCNTNNERSVISAIIPRVGAGNTLPILDGLEARDAALFVSNLNSIVFDYVARNKIQSRHLNKYILDQLPVVPAEGYTRKFGSKTAAEIIREAALELTYTADDLSAFAVDMGYVDTPGVARAPFGWDEDRRLQLRAKIDAVFFILYGVFDPSDPAKSRDDIRFIYGTFPTVERAETLRWKSYRSRELCLAWVSALMAGKPDAHVDG